MCRHWPHIAAVHGKFIIGRQENHRRFGGRDVCAGKVGRRDDSAFRDALRCVFCWLNSILFGRDDVSMGVYTDDFGYFFEVREGLVVTVLLPEV